jgi:UDP-N-acetylmuramate--alanine ligase
MLLEKMKNENKKTMTKDEMLNWLKKKYTKELNKEFGEVLITAGAGDIDMLIEPIKKVLKEI